jgi:hypothetical protein
VGLTFGIGNNQGEVAGALHLLTIQASDNQAVKGSFQFYYYVLPA